MSEEVEKTPAAPAEILPAKSEDKLIIEIEEKESEKQEDKPEEKTEEKTDVEEKEEKEESAKEEADIEAAEDKKDTADDTEKGEDEEGEKDTEEDGKEVRARKKFKLPKVELKAPKVPAFIRNISKERKKNKNKTEDKDDEEAEEGEAKEETAKGEGEEEAGAGGEGEDTAKETDDKEDEEPAKSTKTKVKEAIENIHMPKMPENIHMPKMPKVHKPKFLKKKKEDKEEGEGDGEDVAEGEKEKEEGAEDDKEPEEEKKDGEAEEEDKEKKSTRIINSLKNIKSQVHVPAFLSKKSSTKDKDVEAGDKEEAKELLEKKDGDDKGEGDDKKEKPEEDEAEDKKEEGEEKTIDQTDGKPAQSRGAALLESIRSVASHVPAIFRKPKDKEADVEAGEKDELLNQEEDSNKKQGEGGDELKEVKVDDGSSPIKKDPDASSHDSEKKDPEKGGDEGEGGKKKIPPAVQQQLDRAKEVIGTGANRCRQRFDELERDKKLLVIGVLALFFLIIFIIIICAAAAPSAWSNEARIVGEGKYVETHTTCGPIQGLVEAPDQFSFKRIPYASSVVGSNRWTHSKPKTNLQDCHEGTYIAHSHNDSSGSCWRKYGMPLKEGVVSGDTEECLTLDIFTSNVVYNQLMPVVVYIDGDELSQEMEETIRPTAELAKKHGVVFVRVNYRLGVFGFLSLNSLSARAYPKSSGSYGLGDIISALEWLKLNIQHFGGHPKQITMLGRGSGATMVTALTAAPKAKGLFKQAWVTNGAGVINDKSLKQASKENKRILQKLNCGSDEVDCLIDAAAEDLVEAVPSEWLNTRMATLPKQRGTNEEKGHSWIVIDKNILMESLMEYWKRNKGSNNVPLVIGATAQGAVTQQNMALERIWNDDALERRVETSLGSFNVTIPGEALKRYRSSLNNPTHGNWLIYSTMVTDIRTVCPLQDMASTLGKNFAAKVYSYVATQKRNKLDKIADSTSDIEAIFDMYKIDDEYQHPPNKAPDSAEKAEEERIAGAKMAAEQTTFVQNIQDMFYEFVRTGELPQNKDVSQGMYTVDAEITTQKDYPNCDFWKNTKNIVPTFANLD